VRPLTANRQRKEKRQNLQTINAHVFLPAKRLASVVGRGSLRNG
jgi:hypothetical protein